MPWPLSENIALARVVPMAPGVAKDVAKDVAKNTAKPKDEARQEDGH